VADNGADQLVLDAWGGFRQRLKSFLTRRVRSEADADDLLQTILLRLHEHRGNISPNRLAPWLFVTARNALVDRDRARRKERLTGALALDLPDATPPNDGESAAKELSRCIRPLLGLLCEPDRRILQRVELEGATQSELALEESLPVSTVKSRVQRARRRLRRLFDQCCSIDLDRRGSPTGYVRRNTTVPPACSCDPAMIGLKVPKPSATE
jgi:RNA polymerase sigma-70 factor (ECF subfamily)